MSQNVQMFVINSSSDVHISCISVSNLTEIFYNFILCHLELFRDISSTFALFHQFECVYLSYLLLKCSLHGRLNYRIIIDPEIKNASKDDTVDTQVRANSNTSELHHDQELIRTLDTNL